MAFSIRLRSARTASNGIGVGGLPAAERGELGVEAALHAPGAVEVGLPVAQKDEAGKTH